MAGLGLELAIFGSAVRLAVDCAREPGLQKCDLFLRSLAKIRMHFLNVSHLMIKPTKWPLCPAKTQQESAWASAQSDQSLRSALSWGPNFSSCGQQRLWSDWADAHAMRRLMYTLQLSRLASRASLTADPGVAGSTPARPHIVRWNWSCGFFHW